MVGAGEFVRAVVQSLKPFSAIMKAGKVNTRELKTFNLADLCNTFQNLICPFIILCIELVGTEAILTGGGTDDVLIIYVQGDSVPVRHLLRQNGAAVGLDLLLMPVAVNNAVELDTVEAEQRFDITFRAERGGIDPYLTSLRLKIPD